MQRRWIRAHVMIPFLFAITVPGHGTLAAHQTSAPGLVVEHLRVEHDENALGLGTRTPRLSWWIRGPARGIVQAEYQIQVARTADDLTRGRNLVWDSNRVTSSESTLRPYAGPAVESRRRYYWRVRVSDSTYRESAWSMPAWWEMGLLDPSDWTAQWIEPDLQEDPSVARPAPITPRRF